MCNTVLIHQVLEKVVLHLEIGQLLAERLVHRILFQCTDSKDGKGSIGEIVVHKVLNVLVRRQFLGEIVGWEG